jgi:hypothetical protein
LLKVVGVVGARDFRDAVLKQRELLMEQGRGAPGGAAAASLPAGGFVEGGEAVMLLREIRDSLKRLEGRG